MNAHRRLAVLLCILLAACEQVPLLPPSETARPAGERLFSMQLTVEDRELSGFLLVASEPNLLRVAGMDPFTNRLFTLSFDGVDVRQEWITQPPPASVMRELLAGLQLALWPAAWEQQLQAAPWQVRREGEHTALVSGSGEVVSVDRTGDAGWVITTSRVIVRLEPMANADEAT